MVFSYNKVMFADNVEVTLKAGKGGDGLLSFRHEKYRAKGGPDGGDGGHGGNVVLRVDHNLNTLSAFRKQRLVKAEDGQPGGGDRKHGKTGENVVLPVPAGTQVYTGEQLVADLTQEDQTFVVAKGGRGGFGNAHFTSSTRQVPRATELGEQGAQEQVRLELKLVADVGLVGLPNAGKSTLLAVLSNARPEIGDYPFTTLVPNLGVVDVDATSVLIADIPGLIEGASRGKGLGDEFLRHVERTAVLLHLIDTTSEQITDDYNTIVRELQSYQVDLTRKPQLIVPTKIEAVPEDLLAERLAEIRKLSGDGKLYSISSQAHRGLAELMRATLPLVENARKDHAAEQAEASVPVIDETTQPDLWRVEVAKKGFIISGQKLEGFGRRTDWNNDASVERLRDILRKQGVAKELARLGAQPGVSITLGSHTFEWLD